MKHIAWQGGNWLVSPSKSGWQSKPWGLNLDNWSHRSDYLDISHTRQPTPVLQPSPPVTNRWSWRSGSSRFLPLWPQTSCDYLFSWNNKDFEPLNFSHRKDILVQTLSVWNYVNSRPNYLHSSVVSTPTHPSLSWLGSRKKKYRRLRPCHLLEQRLPDTLRYCFFTTIILKIVSRHRQ